MIVHEVFAQIENEEVVNIIVCENYPTADHLTKCIYGDKSFAVDCLQYPCRIGDKYHDGYFWHINQETGEETKVEYVPTQEQQVSALTSENEELTMTLADTIGGVV